MTDYRKLVNSIREWRQIRPMLYEEAAMFDDAADAIEELVEKAQPEKVCIANVTLSEEQVREAVEMAKRGIVQVFPSAQPERKKGKWERHYSRPNVYADLFWHCSECGYKSDNQYAYLYYNFCPNCGADMREKE